MNIVENYRRVKSEIPDKVTLVAVSKTKPSSLIMDLYREGCFDFGENKVQDLVAKAEELPHDINWHFIGHLQTNKVKYIVPFVHLIHAVDSLKLLKMIDKEAKKNKRLINCLLQIHIAEESSKFGLTETELIEILESPDIKELENVNVTGLMGMATYTDVSEQIRKEFQNLKLIFDNTKKNFFENESAFSILSMGMSGDYPLAIEEGSNMVRVGSSIFGARHYI